MRKLAGKLLTPSMISAVICWCMIVYLKLMPVNLETPIGLTDGLSTGNSVVDGYFFLHILYLMAFLFTVLTFISIYYIVKCDDEK